MRRFHPETLTCLRAVVRAAAGVGLTVDLWTGIVMSMVVMVATDVMMVIVVVVVVTVTVTVTVTVVAVKRVTVVVLVTVRVMVLAVVVVRQPMCVPVELAVCVRMFILERVLRVGRSQAVSNVKLLVVVAMVLLLLLRLLLPVLVPVLVLVLALVFVYGFTIRMMMLCRVLHTYSVALLPFERPL